MAERKQSSESTQSIFGLSSSEAHSEQSGMPSSSPGLPQVGYAHHQQGGASSKGLYWLVGILVLLTMINLALAIMTRVELRRGLSRHSDQLTLLTRRMDASDDRYATLRAQFQVTGEKLGLTQQELSRARSLAADIQKQQQAAVQELNKAIAQKASAEEMNRLQSESATRFGALSGDIEGTRKDLEATKEALMGTRSELSGAIARTHDELVALAHRTDRDFFEFSLTKKGARQKVGTVLIELSRTNTKKNQYTVNLVFDDKRTERKDKAIYEPVYFYVQGAPSALELVVNKLGKDSISGYLSAPKGFFPNTPNVLTARPGA